MSGKRELMMISPPEPGFEGFVHWTFEVVEETQRRVRLRAYVEGRRIDLALFPNDIRDHFKEVT